MKKSTRPSAAVFAGNKPALRVGSTDCLSDRFANLTKPARRLTLSRVIDPRNLLDYDSEPHISTEDFARVKLRLYLPKGHRSSDGAVYFVHGGDLVMGNTEIYEGLMRRMGKMIRMPIVSMDYRLAPETQYPGGLHDVERALIHFFERSREFDVDPTKIVAMGDSAGGNLVAAVAQRLRENKEVPLAGQVLLYPLLQFHNLQSDSFRHFHRDMVGYALVDPVSLAYYYMWYAGIDVNHRPALAEAAISNGHVSARERNLTGAYTDLHNLPTRRRHKGLPTVTAVVENEEAQMLMEERLLDPSFSPLIQHDLTGLPPSFVKSPFRWSTLLRWMIFYALIIPAEAIDWALIRSALAGVTLNQIVVSFATLFDEGPRCPRLWATGPVAVGGVIFFAYWLYHTRARAEPAAERRELRGMNP